MADTYSPISLVKHVHSIPHISKSMKILDDSETYGAGLSITGVDYDASLGMMGGLVGLLGIIAFVIICVYACCCSKKRGYYSMAERKSTYTRKAAITCCIIISLLAVGISVTNSFVDKKISSISDEMDSMQSTYSNNVQGGKDLASAARQVAELLKAKTFDAPTCQQTAQTIINDMDSFADYATGIVNDAPTIDLTSTDLNLIKKVNFYRSIGMYSFGGLIGLLSLLMACTRVRNGCVILLFAICFIGSWVLASVQFSFAIGAADICYDPSPFVSNLLGNDSNVNYYLQCDGSQSFPFQTDFDAASALLQDTYTQFDTLNSSADCVDFKYFVNLKEDIDDVNSRIINLNASMQCPGPHNEYIDFLNTVCHDAYPMFAYMEICQVVQAIFFCFALGFAVNVWKHRNDIYGDDDDRRPLLGGGGSSIQREPPVSNENFRFSRPMRGAKDLYQDKTPSPVCGVCQDRPISTILRPCNHTICQQCSRQVIVCPWCRKEIVERASIHIP